MYLRCIVEGHKRVCMGGNEAKRGDPGERYDGTREPEIGRTRQRQSHSEINKSLQSADWERKSSTKPSNSPRLKFV